MKNANARKRNREYRDRLKKKLAEKAQAEQAARKNDPLSASGHRKDAGQGVSEDGEFEWDSDYNLGRETDADGETDDECPPEKTKTAVSFRFPCFSHVSLDLTQPGCQTALARTSLAQRPSIGRLRSKALS